MSILTSPPVVKFAGNDLNQVAGLLITKRNDFEPAERVTNQYKLARTNKSVLTTAEFKNKPVTIECVITRPNRALLRDSIDQLNGLLTAIEDRLDILQDGVVRRYTGTMKMLRVAETQGGYAKVSIQFMCSDPFGYDESATSLLEAVESTSGNTSFQISVGGSAAVEPIITIEFTGITDGTGGTVQVTNTRNGIGISVTRDWVTGDILEINGEEKKVRINGSEINPTGKILSFLPGLRQIGYVDDFTARTYEITAQYTKRYL